MSMRLQTSTSLACRQGYIAIELGAYVGPRVARARVGPCARDIDASTRGHEASRLPD